MKAQWSRQTDYIAARLITGYHGKRETGSAELSTQGQHLH